MAKMAVAWCKACEERLTAAEAYIGELCLECTKEVTVLRNAGEAGRKLPQDWTWRDPVLHKPCWVDHHRIFIADNKSHPYRVQ